MTSRLAGIALAGLLLLSAPAYADDPETKKAADDKGTLMSLHFEQTPIAKVIDEIARRSGSNIFVHPDVKGEVTIDFTKVPWRVALDVIVQPLGFKVVEQDNGVLMVVPIATPKSATPPKAPTGLGSKAKVKVPSESVWIDISKKDIDKARSATRARLAVAGAAAEHAKIALALARSQSRIAELQAQVDRARADGRDRDVRTLHAEALKAYAKKAKLATAARKAQLVRVYDVRDIKSTDKRLTKAIAHAKHNGGIVNLDRTSLVVRGAAEVQAHIARTLAAIRTGAIVIVDGAGEFVIVDQEGRKRTVLVPGYVETSKPGKAPLVVRVEDAFRHTGRVLDSAGRPLPGVTLSPRVLRMDALVDGRVAAAKKRIESLQKALVHLKVARAKTEARGVAKQIAVAKEQLAQMQAEIEAKRAATAEAATRAGRVRLRLEGMPGRSSEAGAAGHGALQALHKEVRALRGDVRELTGLVRKLLEEQKRRR